MRSVKVRVGKRLHRPIRRRLKRQDHCINAKPRQLRQDLIPRIAAGRWAEKRPRSNDHTE